MVKVSVRTALPGRVHILDLPPTIEVSELRAMVSEEIPLPLDRLKLIFNGKTLSDFDKDQAVSVNLVNGEDSILAVVAPKAPPKHVQNTEVDDEDDLRYKIPESATAFQKRIIYFLQQKLKIPDIALILIFSISLRTWIVVLAWFAMAPIAYKWGVGPIYILATAFAVIFINLGKRQEGEASAYSIFNEGFRELPGTLNAERLDRDIRAGQF